MQFHFETRAERKREEEEEEATGSVSFDVAVDVDVGRERMVGEVRVCDCLLHLFPCMLASLRAACILLD